MSKIKFNGKVAIVTGAGGGLGKTYALALAERGASVVVNDILHSGEKDVLTADSVVEEIKKSGGEAVASYDSVATIKGGQNIVQTAVDNYGKVDILINNAGIILDKSLAKMSEKDWDDVLTIHLKGAFCVTQPAFELMKQNGYGRIINTTSGSGLYGNFGQSNYSSAKMGLVGFMGSIATEGAKYNIKCNTIAPIADSQMTKGLFPPEMAERLKPEFVTPIVLYLASEENQETKKIFNCAAGWFSRTEILCSPGICIGDGKSEIKAEEIRDNWEKINSLDGAKPLSGVLESFNFFSSLLS